LNNGFDWLQEIKTRTSNDRQKYFITRITGFFSNYAELFKNPLNAKR